MMGYRKDNKKLFKSLEKNYSNCKTEKAKTIKIKEGKK